MGQPTVEAVDRRDGGAPPPTMHDDVVELPTPEDDHRATPWSRDRRLVVGLGFVLVLPLAAAAVALRSRRWSPTLDLAMTELRVRDVGGGDTPLVGLPGRIGPVDDQGSHPGPVSFYGLAPAYRLFGSSAWALQVATVLVHTLAIGAALAIARRRGGTACVVAVGALVAVLVHGYGLSTLIEPWNPFLPLLVWLVALLALWSVLCGDHAMVVVVVVAASWCAQTHVPYLGLGVVLGALAAGAVVVAAVRAGAGVDRRRAVQYVLLAAGVGAVLWSPPVVDQLAGGGNLSALVEHFTDPPEAPIGPAEGARVVLSHLDPVRLVTHAGPGGLIAASQEPTGPALPGALVVAAWGVTVAGAVRLRHRALLALHAVVGAGLLLAVLAAGRIFGKVWYYLLLWLWPLALLLALASLWTVAEAAGRRRAGARPRVDDRAPDGGASTFAAARPARRALVVAGAAVIAVTVASSTVMAVGVRPTEERLSATLTALVPPTVAALDAGTGAATGRSGRYQVVWDDALHIGAQGFGLLNELERAGFDALAEPRWSVPVTSQRTGPATAVDAVVVLATGTNVVRWRATPGAVEVVAVEPRTPTERIEFDRLRTEVRDELAAAGLAELVAGVDVSLLGVTIDDRVPAPTTAKLQRMLDLGVEEAVFVVAPSTAPG